jgi:hypothetical protein
MLDAADALAEMGPGTEQTATAMALFGDKGRQLLPVLAQGRAGVQRMTDEFDELGGGLDGETIDAMAGMTREFQRAKQAVMGALMPAIRFLVDGAKKLVDKIRPAIDHFKQMTSNSHVVRAALIALGTVAAGLGVAMAVSFAPVIAILGGVAIGAAAVGFAIDEVITTFEGGDSLIRRFIDSIWGVGATAAVVEEMKNVWAGLVVIFDQNVAAAGQLVEAFAPVGEALGGWKSALTWILQAIPKLIQYATPLGALGNVLGSIGRVGATSRQAQAATERTTQRRAAGDAYNALPQGTGNRIAIPEAPSGFRFDRAQLSASPTASATAAAPAAASSRRIETRATVNINGVVEDGAFLRRIQGAVQEGLAASHEQAAEALERTTGE